MTSDPLRVCLKWMKGAASGGLLSFTVKAKPAPASRPRMTRFGGIHYTPSYEEFYATCQTQLAAQRPAEPIEGPLVAFVDIRAEAPKKTVLSAPRGDCDNFAKGVLDGATKAKLWGDDGQVHALLVLKRWTQPGECPGATLHIGALAT